MISLAISEGKRGLAGNIRHLHADKHGVISLAISEGNRGLAGNTRHLHADKHGMIFIWI
jgi:hypothetical protein